MGPENVAKLQRASVATCLLGGGVAAGVLATAGLGLSLRGLVVAGAPIVVAAALAFHCGSLRPLPFVASVCHAMAVMLASGFLAGTIATAALPLDVPLVDDRLTAIDTALFGVDTMTVTTAVSRNPAIAAVLGTVYFLSAALVVPVVLLLARQRRYERVAETAFVFAVTVLICSIVSIATPAIGTFAHLGIDAAVLNRLPAGAGIYHLEQFIGFRSGTRTVVDWTELTGVITFPSFHVCFALIPVWATRDSPRLATLSAGLAIMTLVSAIPIGGHYMIDLIGGGIVTAVGIATAGWLRRSPAEASRGVGRAQPFGTARRLSAPWWAGRACPPSCSSPRSPASPSFSSGPCWPDTISPPANGSRSGRPAPRRHRGLAA